MNITQAKSAMKKLFGVKAMWRYDEKAPTADERERLKAILPGMVATRNERKEAMEKRRLELLQDPEYVRLKQEYTAAAQVVDNAQSIVRHYRVVVGRETGGMFFHVVAEGDNWQDAIDKARALVKQ